MTGILWDGKTMHERTVTRLNWGCGTQIVAGWTNSDEVGYANGPPNHLGRIQDGLPWADGFFDYCVAHHSLMGLPEPDLVPALIELRRVTKPGGWLRVSVPDIEGAISALRRHDRKWFPLDAAGVHEAFCRYVTQNGATRSIFTRQRLVQLLLAAGWGHVSTSDADETSFPWPEITGLDSRPDESIFMEAVNPGG